MGGHHANRISMLGSHCPYTSTHPRQVHGIQSHLTAIFKASAKMASKEESEYCSCNKYSYIFTQLRIWFFRMASLGLSILKWKMNVMLRFKQIIFFQVAVWALHTLVLYAKLCSASLFCHANSNDLPCFSCWPKI